MKKVIYLISGLGADERVFQNLDFGDCELRFLAWIPPLSINESLSHYAARLSEKITTKKPIILGLSFGGMIAVEIAKIIDCQQVIIISSAKSHLEIPLFYRLIGRLGLHTFVPFQLLRRVPFLPYWTFGMKTEAEQKRLAAILADIDPQFLKWAIQAILRWKNDTRIKNLTHIHGTKDRVLPLVRAMNADFVIEKGAHLMIYTQADEINNLLKTFDF